MPKKIKSGIGSGRPIEFIKNLDPVLIEDLAFKGMKEVDIFQKFGVEKEYYDQCLQNPRFTLPFDKGNARLKEQVLDEAKKQMLNGNAPVTKDFLRNFNNFQDKPEDTTPTIVVWDVPDWLKEKKITKPKGQSKNAKNNSKR